MEMGSRGEASIIMERCQAGLEEFYKKTMAWLWNQCFDKENQMLSISTKGDEGGNKLALQ